jgi:hypothetical protein
MVHSMPRKCRSWAHHVVTYMWGAVVMGTAGARSIGRSTSPKERTRLRCGSRGLLRHRYRARVGPRCARSHGYSPCGLPPE